MNLQQIRAFCALVENDMNVSRTALALYTSQSAVSKQIAQLEERLGTALLIRSKSRILALTEVGDQVLRCMRTMMAATEDISNIVADQQLKAQGRLAIATTHTHARYALQDIVPEFCRRNPSVALRLIQATPLEIADLVATGKVDIGLSTVPPVLPPSLAAIPCYELNHVLVSNRGHPVLKDTPLTLESIARYPLITYSEQHAIGRRITQAFDAAGLAPKIAVQGTDVEIMKHYAASGVGLAIIPVIAFSQSADRGLQAQSVDHLFPISIVHVLARRGAYWPRHLYDFLGKLAPDLTPGALEEALIG